MATDGGEPEDVALVRVNSQQENIEFEVQNSVLYLDFKDQDAIRSLTRFAAAAAHGDTLRVEEVEEEDLSLDDLAPFFPSDEDDEQEIVTDGGQPADAHEYESAETVRETLETLNDVNHVTRRVNSALNHIRAHGDDPAVQVVIAELSSSDDPENCPECGSSAFYPQGGPGTFWCEVCELEFWQEGDDWYSCDASGEPEILADGGANYHELTGFQRDCLWSVVRVGVQTDEDVYGLAIKRDLEERYEGEIHHGRLYPNMNSLVEKGLLEKHQIDRRTNEYELTPLAWNVLGEVSSEREVLLDKAAEREMEADS